jgi:ubiquinone/menaquinone biosynthesis C-methylase UbiE
MRYTPDISDIEIRQNHLVLEERALLFKREGLDFTKSREMLFEKTGVMAGRILEIGCGKGSTSLALARAGYFFTGIDNNEDMLKITAMNLAYYDLLGHADLRIMDTYAMEFGDKTFDSIVMVDALHHMEDTAGVLKGTDRVLAAGGKLFLMDFNDKGRRIVEKAHADEGREHDGCFSGKSEAREWLIDKRYDLEEHEEDCHWIIVATRQS